MTDWTELTARASFASHRLIGWIYWDPRAIELYTALGVPNGLGYYAASRPVRSPWRPRSIPSIPDS
jgi:hypothetical protein